MEPYGTQHCWFKFSHTAVYNTYSAPSARPPPLSSFLPLLTDMIHELGGTSRRFPHRYIFEFHGDTFLFIHVKERAIMPTIGECGVPQQVDTFTSWDTIFKLGSKLMPEYGPFTPIRPRQIWLDWTVALQAYPCSISNTIYVPTTPTQQRKLQPIWAIFSTRNRPLGYEESYLANPKYLSLSALKKADRRGRSSPACQHSPTWHSPQRLSFIRIISANLIPFQSFGWWGKLHVLGRPRNHWACLFSPGHLTGPEASDGQINRDYWLNGNIEEAKRKNRRVGPSEKANLNKAPLWTQACQTMLDWAQGHVRSVETIYN